MSVSYVTGASPVCRNCLCEFNRLAEALFWTRIMQEHALFIKLGLPASEPELIKEAEEFVKRFGELRKRLKNVCKLDGELLEDLIDSVKDIIKFKAKLLRMLIECKAEPKSFNTVLQFTKNVIAAATELRNFKAAAFELAELCRILSIVSTPLLLDHVRREADKFLDEMEVLLQAVKKCSPCM